MTPAFADKVLSLVESSVQRYISPIEFERAYQARAWRSTAFGSRSASPSSRRTNRNYFERPRSSFSIHWTGSKKRSGVSTEDFSLFSLHRTSERADQPVNGSGGRVGEAKRFK
jgi:hypothetical protein